MDFDAEQWEDLIDSDELLPPRSNSNANIPHKDVLKLTSETSRERAFFDTTKFIYMARSMSIICSPSKYQRVRYENECRNTVRYISVPDNRTFAIKIPDLRDLLVSTETLWMRITRTTVCREKNQLIFYHPYPLWIRNRTARIHHGSIYISISRQDMENGFIEMNTLTMFRLKQEDLVKMGTLGVYSSDQLDFSGLHLIGSKKAKDIRDDYQLQQSLLNFQLVRVDENHTAYPTDCFCQTEPIYELEAVQIKASQSRKKSIRSLRGDKIKRSRLTKRERAKPIPAAADDRNMIPYSADLLRQMELIHELQMTAQIEASHSGEEP